MKISCVVIEDEPLALDKMVSFIETTSSLELLAQFSDPIQAIDYLLHHSVDLVFLDIQMQGINGLQLLQAIQNRTFQVVFTTAHIEYAIQGYDYQVVDFLLKPFSYERFIQAVQKVFAGREKVAISEKHHFIFVKSDYKILRVDIHDILYIEGMGDYRRIICASNKVITPITFIEFAEILPPDLFVRIHKSYIVSLAKIESVENQRVCIAQKRLPVGDTYKEQFYRKLSLLKH